MADVTTKAHGRGHRGAYLAFDRFPSSKGAAIHMEQMAAHLFERFGGGMLCCLGGGGLPRYQREGGIEIVRFDAEIPNLIDRAEAFSSWVADQLRPHRATLEICHVRDPWSALPALSGEGGAMLVYEANGFPSIELPSAWPMVAPSTIAKIRDLERYCLNLATAVIVPSQVIADAVGAMGVEPGRIHLVPNGAEVPDQRPPRPADAPDRYLVYVGALQPWQGVDVLLRAFARLADLDDLRLVVCSSVPAARARGYQRLADRLGVSGRVEWRFALPHAEVAAWLTHAELSVAPLTGCSRNIDQGCSPLKIWESMASGTPVVASGLPAVRELVVDTEHGRLVHPDRPAELARAIRVLLEYPELAHAMGQRARRRVLEGFTWAHTRARLGEVYDNITSQQGHKVDTVRSCSGARPERPSPNSTPCTRK